MSAPVVLVTGGASSGKTRYACRRAAACGPRVLYVATCRPEDEEMRSKVARHRRERPPGWSTVERTGDVAGVLGSGFDAAVVDSLTLLVAAQVLSGADGSAVEAEVERLVAAPPCPLFLVTDEVGWGIVPGTPVGRLFRDLVGRANQVAAARADEVVVMVAGIPVVIKGGGG